ncbi:hypothetical protein FRC08_009933 [Ceratobasidium sp. 394]|nr:hypothetical protein FRC08_009933 [Ceratobasidium sp. 394]
MPNYQLSNIRTLIKSSDPQPVSLHTILKSPTEPTATASGVLPGQALYDTPEPDTNAPEPEEPEPEDSTRRSQRVHIDTPAIAQFRQQIKEQQAHRRNKSRQSSANPVSTTEPSSGEEDAKAEKTKKPRRKRRKSKSRKSKKSNSGSVSEQSTHDASESETNRLDGVVHLVAGREATSGCGGSPSSNLHRAGLPPPALPESPAPGVSEIPGVPGPAPSTHHGQAGLRNEALEHKRLVDELTRRTEGTVFAEVPLETLKLMLKEVVFDQTPEVESPKRKAEARALAKNPIDVGGGHHMKITQSNSNYCSQS